MLSENNDNTISAGYVLSIYEIVECFGKIMMGYLLFMEKSEIVKKSKHIDTILYNGANIVIHVFTIHMYCNSTLEIICEQCCKSYVCYLEYIEQLDKANLANNLYISDISIFVYKQTLGELETNGQSSTSNNFIIELLTRVWNTIFIWNSSISLNARIAICNTHFNKYVKLLNNIHDSIIIETISGDNIASARTPELRTSVVRETSTSRRHSVDDTSSQDKADSIDIYIYIDYLKTIQEKWEMDEHIYFIFLNEYYRVLYNLHKSSKLPNRKYMREQIVIFCAHYLEYKPNTVNMQSIVKQLL